MERILFMLIEFELKSTSKLFFWIFFVNAIALGYLGGKPAEGIYVILSRVATAWYFTHFLIILPVLGMFETTKPLPKSIAEPVLGGFSSTPEQAYAAPRRS